jgi:hypothetical protein
VGGDVLAAFYLSEQDLSVHAIPGTPEKYFLDLNIVAGRQLLALGLQPENIAEVIAARFWMRDGFTPTDAISKRVVWQHWFTSRNDRGTFYLFRGLEKAPTNPMSII